MTEPSNPAKDRVTRISWEALLAAAARRLVKLDHVAAAVALSEAAIVQMIGGRSWSRVAIHAEVSADHFDALTDPAVYARYEGINNFNQPYEVPGSSVLAGAFTDVLPPGVDCESVEVKIRVDPVTEDWREQVRGGLESGTTNQGRQYGTSRVVTHSGMNYRSKPEVAIAKVLELSDEILFLPNCAAVTGKVRKEPDFLIFFKKRVGILEVDGPTHSGRMADDSLRDSFFQRQGIFVKHYPAEKCLADPTWVVRDFLALLAKAP